MDRSQELSEFVRGTIIGCLQCNKSIHEISSLLNIPRSTVCGIITKWKQLGTTATQPQSGRPRKMTKRGQLSSESTKDLQTSYGLQISTTTVHREVHGMGFYGQAAASKPYITKCNTNHRMQWCKARCYWTLEQWRRVLWSDQSRFYNSTCLTALCQV
ncbi:unnamed protein product [Staurois parvus]|uniref:Transposase Tc1-like domain-containing protein n=1 Tax=Staurois parvus TaxID=386267 RepID=A0ABN9F3F4_9NEOB|nr:unnamed protein product [Staurois parvus]